MKIFKVVGAVRDAQMGLRPKDTDLVVVGSSPEEMIKNYGADSVRWFILSDSPPEKDVQWSDIGVISANKFLQKVYNLIFLKSSFCSHQTF